MADLISQSAPHILKVEARLFSELSPADRTSPTPTSLVGGGQVTGGARLKLILNRGREAQLNHPLEIEPQYASKSRNSKQSGTNSDGFISSTRDFTIRFSGDARRRVGIPNPLSRRSGLWPP